MNIQTGPLGWTTGDWLLVIGYWFYDFTNKAEIKVKNR
jgi:hypothetical protein